jgi:hypothetical protein
METGDKYEIETNEHYWFIETRSIKDQNSFLITRCQVIEVRPHVVRIKIEDQASCVLKKKEVETFLFFRKAMAITNLSKMVSDQAFDLLLAESELAEFSENARNGDKKAALGVMTAFTKLTKLERNIK